MQSEKRDVQAKLAAMRIQAEQVISQLSANLDKGRVQFQADEIEAMAKFTRAAGDLGRSIDKLLEAIEWEEKP